MAKGFGGGNAAPALNMTRPMPRPDGLGGVSAEKGARQPFMGQNPMQPNRYDVAMDLLKSAMAGGAQSTSPALQFLTPIIGAMTGSAIQGKQDAARAAQFEALTGGKFGPQAAQAIPVLNDPNAPDYMKDIARTMLAPPKPQAKSGGGGGGKASSSGGKPGVKGRLVGEYWVNGVLHGRDAAGQFHPYTLPDGSTYSDPSKVTKKGAGQPAPAVDDPLGILTAPVQENPDDPLGILQ